MIRLRDLASQTISAFVYHKRPLLAYHLYFSLLALLALSPMSGWALAALVELSGYQMVGNQDLVRFLLTPLGIAWMLASASVIAFFVFFQSAGMILIATRQREDRFHTASNALWQVLKHFKALFKLAAMQVICHLVLAAPSLALLIISFEWLLGGYDIYYVINAYPTELFYFLPIACMLLVALLLGNGLLYASWSLALPAMLFERMQPRAALRRSWQLVKGARFHVARVILMVGLVTLLLPIVFTAIFDAGGAALMTWLPGPAALQVALMGVLIVVYVVLAFIISFFAISANSLIVLQLYMRCCGYPPIPLSELEPRATARLAWAFEAALVVVALGQLVFIVQSFDSREYVANIAHRGASWDAPENSLAAIATAINQGADYIELDVQQTADGTLVLLHDRDLLRIAGDRRAIWEIDYSELLSMDAGSWFALDFASERVATLAEAIELMRGRAQLYLEIKTSPQMPDLVAATVAELQRLDFVADTVAAGLSPQVLNEAVALEPNLRTSLLVHTAIGTLGVHPYSALGLREGIVTPRQIRAARQGGYALHVWTVNNRRDMHRYIDMGVDGIITDAPALLSDVLAEREKLNRSELLLLRMRHWVW